AQLARERLGLRLVHGERLDDGETVLAHELRQDRRHAGAIHLAVHFLREVLVGRIGEDLPAAAPQRARRHARARAPRALLAPGLARRVAHFAARLLLARAGAAVRVIRDHHLVHERFVVRAAEEGVGGSDRRLGLALVVDDLELHHLPPFFGAGAFTLGHTTTAPFFAPGIEPFTMMSERSASTRATSSSWIVRFTSPRWPDMRLP